MTDLTRGRSRCQMIPADVIEAPVRSAFEVACSTDKAMAKKNPSPRKGRKPPQGNKKEFLTTIDPEVIRQIKQAAIGLDKTASEMMEEAPTQRLERHRAGKK